MRHLEMIADQNYAFLKPVQFGHQDCPPLWSHGPAIRTFWLLHFVVSGKGVFHRDGVLYEVNAGDIFVIPPYEETFYQADEKEPWHYIWLGFHAEKIPENVLNQAIIHRPDCEKIFRDMCRCEEMESGKAAYLCGKVWELFALLLEEKAPLPSPIDRALGFFASEYANPIRIADVAKKLNLDRSYFSALFKKTVGISPVDYLIRLRLEKAAEMIRLYKIPPTVAALSCGFSDYCNFSKAFKKKYGVSPRQYR